MLKRLVNEARLTLKITTTGPLLIKSSHATIKGPDMTPVLTYRNDAWQVYLPGSSLKGVFRSHLEKICRTLKPESPVVCNPFWALRDKADVKNGQLICPDYVELSCGDKFERRSKDTFEFKGGSWMHKKDDITSVVAYAESCPICRLFGSTEFTGRISINDAYSTQPRPRTEQRDGVGIDRLTGGSFSGALFNLEVVSAGTAFTTDILLRNFETWQLGMLFLVTQDMADELVRIGSGKSRGLGSVKAEIADDTVTINHIGPTKGRTASQVWGLDRFLNDGSYGTRPNHGDDYDDLLEVTHPPQESKRGLRKQAIFGGNSLADLQEQALEKFVQRMDAWTVPDKMGDFAQLGFQG